MPSTLSLSCSKKIYELLGETYETENKWFKRDAAVAISDYWVPPLNWTTPEDMKETKSEPYKYPAPTFSETIRLLPKIAEKKGWTPSNPLEKSTELDRTANECVWIYMTANTETEGMAEVSEYLEKIF